MTPDDQDYKTDDRKSGDKKYSGGKKDYRDGKRDFHGKKDYHGKKDFHGDRYGRGGRGGSRDGGEDHRDGKSGRDNRKPYDGKRGYNDHRNREDRPEGRRENRRDGDRPRRYDNDKMDYRRRDDGRNGRRPEGKSRGKPYDKGRRDDRPQRNEDRPSSGRPVSEQTTGPAQERRQETTLTVPSTPQKILFKGIDCEINGRNDLAIFLYLHGAVKMSGGCENNALRMLHDMGSKEFSTVRGRVAKSCPEDCLLAFDFLCSTLDDNYDRTALRTAAESGSILAIYYMIRLLEVEGDDPCIDVFATGIEGNDKMVEDGLKLLVRKKDSARAEDLLEKIAARKKLRQSVRVEFIRMMKGDRVAARKMDELAKEFPEAMFLRDYVGTEDREQYLRDGMSRFNETILSLASELGVSDTPFGKYLVAKKLQSDGEEWIPSMIAAAGAGSEDALHELAPVQMRRDVKKALSSVYLDRGDAVGLVRSYDGEDTTYLDRYCRGSPDKYLEIGRLMGGMRELEWLKKGYREGVLECKRAIVEMAASGERRNKQLIYALHDVNADLEAAKLYFQMYGDPSIPSVKWLSKVCEDEAAKAYIRSKFEAMGDMETFESIFVDDGYRKKGGRDGRPHRRS